MNEWLSEAELLARVPLRGKRPDVVLKRLREGGLVVSPRREYLGRPQGTRTLYPAETIGRLRSIKRLQARGVRALRDLRWELWFEGADDLWPAVQRDLVEAYPDEQEDEFKALLASGDDDRIADELDDGIRALAEEWAAPGNPAIDSRVVRHPLDVEALASATVNIGIGSHVELDAWDDDEVSVSTLAERAWGPDSSTALSDMERTQAVHYELWRPALFRATAEEAREVVDSLGRKFSPRALRRQMRYFGKDFTDRAVIMGGLLAGVQAGPTRGRDANPQ